MRFILKLQTEVQTGATVTLNYQYPLSAAIYKIIERADKDYAHFLHNTGYQHNNKTFKFFTFSDLRTPFHIKGDRLIMNSNTAELTICFHIPDAAENFVKGIFTHQQLVIADKFSKTVFTIQQVVAEKNTDISSTEEVLLQPMSPVVVGKKKEDGFYQYLSPEDEMYATLLAANLVEKYAAVGGTEDTAKLKQRITIEPVLFKNAPRHRLLAIKEGTAAETKVRGYDKFRLRIKAPIPMIELALNAGIGMHNAMGMGCVGVINY